MKKLMIAAGVCALMFGAFADGDKPGVSAEAEKPGACAEAAKPGPCAECAHPGAHAEGKERPKFGPHDRVRAGRQQPITFCIDDKTTADDIASLKQKLSDGIDAAFKAYSEKPEGSRAPVMVRMMVNERMERPGFDGPRRKGPGDKGGKRADGAKENGDKPGQSAEAAK